MFFDRNNYTIPQDCSARLSSTKLWQQETAALLKRRVLKDLVMEMHGSLFLVFGVTGRGEERFLAKYSHEDRALAVINLIKHLVEKIEVKETVFLEEVTCN